MSHDLWTINEDGRKAKNEKTGIEISCQAGGDTLHV